MNGAGPGRIACRHGLARVVEYPLYDLPWCGLRLPIMSIETIIARYGLLAVGVGAAIEGEAVVLTGGLLAHQGLMPVAGVMAMAAVGSFLADQIFFLLGRRFRAHPRVRSVTARPAFARALAMLERYPIGFIFAFRFLYGLRTISPVAIGASSVPARRFLLLNGAAAIIWGIVIAGMGYAFGQGIELAFGRLRRFEHLGLAAGGTVALAAAVGWIVHRLTGDTGDRAA